METEPRDDGRSAPAARSRRLGAWAEAATILAVGAFFAFSYFAGRVRFFVAPAYIWLSILAAVMLAAMAVARIRAASGGHAACEADEHGTWRVPAWACVVVLIVPVVLAVAVNPRRYSPEGLRKRRIGGRGRDTQLERAVDWLFGLKAGGRKAGASGSLPKDPTVLDVLTAAEEWRPEDLEGRFVKVLGQCDLPDGPASERFDLYRLVVTCCIADATAVSIEVARPPTVALEPGGWVRVEGIIRFDSKVDPALPVIHATMTTKVPEPSDPYL